MPKFKIEIRGIALLFSKDKEWKVIFPFEGEHKVLFSSDIAPMGETDPPRSIPLNQPGRKITISLTDPVISDFDKGPFDTFLDLTASYSHPPGTDRLSKMPNWTDVGVLMGVPKAALRSIVNRGSYKLIGGAESFERAPGQMGYWADLMIEAKTLEVNISGSPAQPTRIYDGDAVLTFDNECYGSGSCAGDMELVYRIIRSSSGNELRTIRHGDPRNRNFFVRFFNFIFGSKKIPGGTTVNPNGGNPTDDEKGLPCHIVVLSKPPADLP